MKLSAALPRLDGHEICSPSCGAGLFGEDAVPPGTWLFGVAVILLGVNVARYIKHISVSGFSVAVGVAAFLAAVSQLWRTDPPLVAIFLLVIGTSLVATPLFTRTA